MSPAFGCKLIELRFSSGLGLLPPGGQKLLVFEAMKCGIKRSLLDLKGLAGHLLDSLSDGVAMNGAKSDDPQDEKIEGALREIEAVVSLHHTCAFYIYAPDM